MPNVIFYKVLDGAEVIFVGSTVHSKLPENKFKAQSILDIIVEHRVFSARCKKKKASTEEAMVKAWKRNTLWAEVIEEQCYADNEDKEKRSRRNYWAQYYDCKV